jgi:hypothetical protein
MAARTRTRKPRKRRKPSTSRAKSDASTKTKKTAKKVSAKSAKNLRNLKRFQSPTRATAQISVGTGEKPLDPVVAWWTGLTPIERDQIGLRLLLQTREFTHLLGDLHTQLEAAVPYKDKRPPRIIPPEEPKG